MSSGAATDALGRIWGASGQRWALIVLAVITAVGASASSGLVAGHLRIELVAVVLLFALVAVVVPDSHAAALVVTVVVAQWLLETDGTASGWSLAAAASLLVFHLAVALMAVAPANAVVPPAVLAPWTRRGVGVAAATIAVWGAVAVLDGRAVAGSAAVVFAALVALTGAVIAIGARSAASPIEPRR